MLRDNRLSAEVYIDGKLVYTSNSVEGQLREMLEDIREVNDKLQDMYTQYLDESQRLMDSLTWSVHDRIHRISEFLKDKEEENNGI